jgi:small-conductance mechanosensitive channel
MELALKGPGGVRLIGITASVGHKLIYTAVLLALLALLRFLVRAAIPVVLPGATRRVPRFWARQVLNLLSVVIFVALTLSIWFDDPGRLATGLGLFSAGVAFALQQVITSLAGYLLILRGDLFQIGDRVVMGGVRGDVMALGFLRTTILEMGAPPGDDGEDGSASWVQSRQFTGRIVNVTNAVVFSAPIYNYSRDIPYIWEELRIPVKYDTDRGVAEQILLEAARNHAVDVDAFDPQAIARLRRRYWLPDTDVEPSVFYRLTDNWLEMTVRFAVLPHGVRQVKSDISLGILAGFEAAGIEIASATYDVVGLPKVQVEVSEPAAASAPRRRSPRSR